MTPFDVLTAVAVPIAQDNVDTDQIFPARFSSRNRDQGGFGTFFFHDRRFDEDGRTRPEFTLTDARLAGAEIIVAAANYGSGSGRPGAIFAHVDYGIRAIVAESFGPVFESVAYKSGILTVSVRHDEAALLRNQLVADLGTRIAIDLPRQVVVAPDGTRIPFAIDPFVKHVLTAGMSETDLTLGHLAAIEAVEARQRRAMPWLAERDGG